MKLIVSSIDDAKRMFDSLNLASTWNPATGIMKVEAMFKPESQIVNFEIELESPQ